MSRKKPKYIKQRKSSFIPVLIVVAVLAIAAAVVVLVQVDRAPAVKQPAAPDVANPTETGQPAETAGVPMDVSFPYALEDDGLELTSLFQYTGSNPDCGWAEGTDVGAVTSLVHSTSQVELTRAMPAEVLRPSMVDQGPA